MIRNTDIAAFVAEKHEISESNASAFVDAAFALILDGLQLGEIVKVKGLGTFKVMQTKERESVDVNTGERILLSSKPKVIFTPDMVLRERVNAPFAGFSSVPLSDGVEVEVESTAPKTSYDESTANYSEANIEPEPSGDEETEATQQSALHSETATAIPAEPAAEQPATQDQVAETPAEEAHAELIEPATATINATTEEAEPEPEEVEVPMISDDNDDTEETRGKADATSRLRVWIWILAALLAISVAACGILLWRINSMAADGEAQEEPQTIVTATDTATIKQAKQPAEKAEELATAEQSDTAKQQASQKAMPKEPAQAGAAASMEHPLQSADPRVKLGAYYIVGTQCEVTVQQGQTFAGISRAYLGEEMECYLEAYNNKTSAKAGDKLLIPKLITKKAWKKKMNK